VDHFSLNEKCSDMASRTNMNTRGKLPAILTSSTSIDRWLRQSHVEAPSGSCPIPGGVSVIQCIVVRHNFQWTYYINIHMPAKIAQVNQPREIIFSASK
jgi:hypothetical protein